MDRYVVMALFGILMMVTAIVGWLGLAFYVGGWMGIAIVLPPFAFIFGFLMFGIGAGGGH